MPAYDPRDVAELASSEDTRAATGVVVQGILDEFGFNELDVVWGVLQNLDSPECRFYKTVVSQFDCNELLDVYHVRVGGVEAVIYLKFKVVADPPGTLNRVVVVLSFKKR